ncbi:hypothetical protein [Herminiimonas sp. CN]|uniref:hypothetical protein n=1 Tax=Herminiimonas sp. CN TaxID=1349818 RepID=UPI0012DF0606|nr:hypothetical protein [Herminiimonas sp. CN]
MNAAPQGNFVLRLWSLAQFPWKSCLKRAIPEFDMSQATAVLTHVNLPFRRCVIIKTDCRFCVF